MDWKKLRAELERFEADAPIEKSWTPPASWYTDPEIFELESLAVFSGTWQPAARTADLQKPGDFASGRWMGEPWVIVRNESGELRAFHNVCSHKGREVVEGCGRAHELVCGYHAWRYDLTGRLTSAPRMAGIQDFDRGVMGLKPMACETWGPWVFINLDAQAAPLKPGLQELDRRLARTSWEELEFFDSKSWTIECNWKVYADNYLDGGYHIPHMHPTLDAQIDMKSYQTELFETFSIQSAPPKGAPDERIPYDSSERIGQGALYAWIFPNLTINRYGPCMDTNYIIPRGVAKCDVVYEFFFLKTGGDDARRFIEESMAQADITQKEDIAICESVQAGLGSRAYDRGRYAPQVETGEFHFHRLLQRQLITHLGDKSG